MKRRFYVVPVHALLAALVVAALAALSAACGGDDNSNATKAPSLTGSAVSGAPTQTPQPATAKLSIMVGGLSKQIYLPNMLAQQLGFFKEQNLDVTLVDEPSGVSGETALLAGDVEAASGSYDHTIDLQGLGKNVVNVVQLLAAPGEAEMVATKKADTVKSPADFKGKTLGVTSIGSGTHLLSQFLAVKSGVAVDQVTFLPVGSGNTFIAAIQQGRIDAGMTTEPTISRLVKTGDAKVLVDLRSPESTRAALGGDYPFICVFMRTDYVNGHKEVVQRLVNAYVKTLKWIQTHTPEEIADKMPADYYAGDKDLYLTALKGSMAMFSSDGRMPAGGPESVLNVLKQFAENVKGKQIDLSKTYTVDFVTKANQ